MTSTNTPPIPDPLPTGWVTRFSKSQKGTIFYFHQETGKCTWDRPAAELSSDDQEQGTGSPATADNNSNHAQNNALSEEIAAEEALVKGVLKQVEKQQAETTGSGGGESKHVRKKSSRDRDRDRDHREHKRARSSHGSSSSGGAHGKVKSVRVLHILKKHARSRRPSSWRRKTITDTKEKAMEEKVEA